MIRRSFFHPTQKNTIYYTIHIYTLSRPHLSLAVGRVDFVSAKIWIALILFDLFALYQNNTLFFFFAAILFDHDTPCIVIGCPIFAAGHLPIIFPPFLLAALFLAISCVIPLDEHGTCCEQAGHLHTFYLCFETYKHIVHRHIVPYTRR